MKVAICISSELRNIKFTFPKLKEFVNRYFLGWEVDYFLYCPNIFIKNYTNVNYIYDENYLNYVDDNTKRYISDLLQPKSFIIENDSENLRKLLEKYKLNNYDYNSCLTSKNKLNDNESHYHDLTNARSFNQYYFAQQVIELKKNYEKENNFKYDLVFRIRPDIYFVDVNNVSSINLSDDRLLGKSDHSKNSWPNSIFVTHMFVKSGCGQITDHCFIGNSESMDNFHKDATKHLVELHNIINENRFKDDMLESLYNFIYPPERKWFFLGMINKISFVNSLSIQECLIRDHFEKNDWNDYDENQKILNHQIYIEKVNHIIGDCVRHRNYILEKIIKYFKQKSIFCFKNEQEFLNFMLENYNIFI
jgi:hypothetical protein